MKTPAATLALLALTITIAHAQVPQSHAWTPDPKLLPRLGPPQKFGPFTMRLPKGYTIKTPTETPATGTIIRYDIYGPLHENKWRPGLIVVIATTPTADRTGFAASLLDGMIRRFSNRHLTASPKQNGVANGLKLVRQYYSWHVKPNSGPYVHACQYATVAGHTAIILSGMDVAPYHITTLPLLQTSILTLHASP